MQASAENITSSRPMIVTTTENIPGTRVVPLRGGRRRPRMPRRPVSTAVPGVKREPGRSGPHTCGTCKPRQGPPCRHGYAQARR